MRITDNPQHYRTAVQAGFHTEAISSLATTPANSRPARPRPRLPGLS
jgi:hypothetical protein